MYQSTSRRISYRYITMNHWEVTKEHTKWLKQYLDYITSHIWGRRCRAMWINVIYATRLSLWGIDHTEKWDVLKFLLNHFFSMRLDEVLLFLQTRQMSHFLLSSVHCKLDFNLKSHMLTLHSSSLHFRNNQVTLVRSMWHTLWTLKRLRTHMT